MLDDDQSWQSVFAHVVNASPPGHREDLAAIVDDATALVGTAGDGTAHLWVPVLDATKRLCARRAAPAGPLPVAAGGALTRPAPA